jgi:hypothetical protein
MGVASVDVDGAKSLRSSGDVLVRGKAQKAIKGGEAVLVRVVLDQPLESLAAGHAGVFVATDADGGRSGNVPTAVEEPGGPFAGLQDVFSVHHVADGAVTELLQSDLGKGWYKGQDAFAVSSPAPGVLDFLLDRRDVGETVRGVTFAKAEESGYDVLTLGPGAAAVPLDGRVGALPLCLEGAISGRPYLVPRLEENGQDVRDIETPTSWLGGGVFRLGEADLAAVAGLFPEAGADGLRRVDLPSTATLISEGQNTRQRLDVALALDGDRLAIGVQLGLPRRGYHVLRDIGFRSVASLDPAAEVVLMRLAASLSESVPPFRSVRQGGVVLGDGQACLPAGLLPDVEAQTAAVPAASDDPAAGDAAGESAAPSGSAAPDA